MAGNKENSRVKAYLASLKTSVDFDFDKDVKKLLNNFLHMEAAGGICLILAAICAIVVANSPLHEAYNYILNDVDFRVGFSDIKVNFDTEIKKPILLWINDGLMAIFFFLVGLEIKREVVQGQLSSRERAVLPFVAALGGVIIPALIYMYCAGHDDVFRQGWAIPAATDIAFALGVLSLLGSRVPTNVKILLTAIAVIDDIIAVLIIAIFYSAKIHFVPLYFAIAILVILFMLNKKHVTAKGPYVLLAIALWVAVLESGLHATLAGVLAAMFVPLYGKDQDRSKSPLVHMEHGLHPWVAFAVLPIFAFANAGVPLTNIGGWEAFMHPVTLGIAAGLFFGKQIGIFAFMVLTHVLRLAKKPDDIGWLHMYGVAVLCGIGFTMSLFVGGLAFTDVALQTNLRIGVLWASILSALYGYSLMVLAAKQNSKNGV